MTTQSAFRIVGAAVLALLTSACARAPAPPVSCEVHRAIYDFWSDGGERVIFMRTYTRTLPMSQWGYLVTPPNSFSHESGETAMVDAGLGLEEIPIQEDFDANVSTYIMPTAFGRQNIAACFTNAADSPQFYDGFPQMLRTSERIATFGEELSLIDVSPVGFSADGDRALVYVEDKCSGWCGGGYFFLLERNDSSWRVIGTSWTWVA